MKPLFMVLALFLGGPVAVAQPVELKGEVWLEKAAPAGSNEKPSMVEPKVVVPGDRLTFGTTWHNTSAARIDRFVVTNPIPAPVVLDALPADVQEVSVDGGKVWGKLASLTVASPDGKVRPALASDVTHLRWVVPVIEPGGSGTLTYRAIVR